MSQIEFYHNLYVSECWQKKKGKIVKRLKENKLQPQVYVITLSQGEQNQLEFFSSVLLKQSIFEHSKLFVPLLCCLNGNARSFLRGSVFKYLFFLSAFSLTDIIRQFHKTV